MKIKAKWYFSFMFMFVYGGQAALEGVSGHWSSLEHRVFYTVGCLMLMVVMLVIIQPWKPDRTE